VSQNIPSQVRSARSEDVDDLLGLWKLLYSDVDQVSTAPWPGNARAWFTESIKDITSTRIPVIEIGGAVVATAIGTVEIGVPNPYCPRGRTVRLANVITLPEHRSHGYGSMLVADVIAWARTVQADRVDLSATPDGQRLYEQLGFVMTTAPRMKLVL